MAKSCFNHIEVPLYKNHVAVIFGKIDAQSVIERAANKLSPCNAGASFIYYGVVMELLVLYEELVAGVGIEPTTPSL